MPATDGIETEDDQHLRWLSIGYYANAGFTVLAGLLGAGICLAMAWMFDDSFRDAKPHEEVARIGVFWGIAAIAFLIVSSNAIFVLLNIRCASHLKNRSRYSFCVGLAGFHCASLPFGTVLGVFSLIVLTRASVRKQFFQPEGITDEAADRIYLRLLSIGYKWVAGFMMLYPLMVGLGAVALVFQEWGKDSSGVFWVRLAIPLLLSLCTTVLPVLMFFVAKHLKAERHLTFCKMVAALSCLFFGYGTTLGVLTLLLLAQPSAERLFATGHGDGSDGPPATPSIDQPLLRS